MMPSRRRHGLCKARVCVASQFYFNRSGPVHIDPMHSTLRSHIVIPARLASTRLPRKLLLAETGKPLIQHTYEAARSAKKPRGICVAADCEEIAAVVRGFGGQVRLTSPDCA